MNFPSEYRSDNGPVLSAPAGGASYEVDVTLRMIAKLPAPVGLEDRVFTAVLAAPRGARILAWPRPLHARDWMRSAAAAAIVLVVGGGGWGIYSHVQQKEPASAIAVPRVRMQPGGFSSAGVIRRPQTLNGPVIKTLAEPGQLAKNQSLKPGEINKSSKRLAKSEVGHLHQSVKAKPQAHHNAAAVK